RMNVPLMYDDHFPELTEATMTPGRLYPVTDAPTVKVNLFYQLRAFLFPYRTHLEEEIADLKFRHVQEVTYLRSQLAQRQRRVDELQEFLIESRNKNPPPRAPRPEPPPPHAAKPVGWDAFRNSRK